MPQLILASESPRRRELLGSLGVDFICTAANVNEADSGDDPASVPQENALLKALAVAAKHPGATVLGADTAILFENRLLGKPSDIADAGFMLRKLSGKEHLVITGMALVSGAEKRVWSEVSRVRFRELTPEIIRQYLQKVNVLDKAGSYAVQEYGDMLITYVGGDINNIIGLPLGNLALHLADLGFSPRLPRPTSPAPAAEQNRSENCRRS